MTLAGHTILLTREAAVSATFIAEAGQRGAAVICLPTIAVTGPDSWEDCDRALDELDRFDILACTSASAVEWFFRRCRERGIGLERLGRLTVGAVGPATRDALVRLGRDPDVMPLQATAKDLVEAFLVRGVEGARVLAPLGDRARPDLAAGLTSGGAHVTPVVVYRTVPAPAGDVESVWRRVRDGGVSIAVFASPSAAAELAALLGPVRTRELPSCTAVAAIGPTTAAECAALGWTPAVVARVATQKGLVEAIDTYLGAR